MTWPKPPSLALLVGGVAHGTDYTTLMGVMEVEVQQGLLPFCFTPLADGEGAAVLVDIGSSSIGTLTVSDALLDDTIKTTGVAKATTVLQVGGNDGTLARALLTSTTGQLHVLVDGSVAVTGTFWQTTQPVSEATLDAAIAAKGAVDPNNVVQVGGYDGTYLRALSVDSTGALNISGGGGEEEATLLSAPSMRQPRPTPPRLAPSTVATETLSASWLSKLVPPSAPGHSK